MAARVLRLVGALVPIERRFSRLAFPRCFTSTEGDNGASCSDCKLRKSDGKALPNRLDRSSMPFFKPPANTLDPFQLELCADAFKQTWFEIAGDCRLPPFQEERLQTEVSAKLCFFAAKGVVDPTVLQVLTVATVKFQPRTGRRRRLTETPQ